MSEVLFINCSVCGVEHVDYLLCGGNPHANPSRSPCVAHEEEIARLKRRIVELEDTVAGDERQRLDAVLQRIEYEADASVQERGCAGCVITEQIARTARLRGGRA